jgi:hypothetical protein
MSDNYEFEKSSRPQDVDGYSPYMDKQYNGFINDLNGGVYTNTSLSLVQFDLGQIYNSQKFTDTNDMFMVVPVTMVAAFSDGSALKDPVAGNINLLSMKSNFIHLIHQADLQINGKTIESTQPYINIAKHFTMLSEMSVNDLATVGYTLGFGESIDNHRSVSWNGNATTKNGNGFTNNRIFAQTGSVGITSTTVNSVQFPPPASRYQTTTQAIQNTGTINDAITSKLSRYFDTTATGSVYNNILGTIVNATQLKAELRPTYEVNNKCMIWNDYAVIKLSNLFESLANIGLVRKFDCTLRLWLNTGTVNVTVANPNVNSTAAAANATAPLQYSITAANNTFTNTCPFTVNYLPDLSANGGIPNTVTNIVAGCYVGKPPTTTFAGVNLSAAQVSGGLSTCRIYYSQIQIEPQKALTYVNENRNKKVVYRTILANQYNNQSGNFNQLINSGVVHPVGILIVPYISSTTANGFGDYQWKSPFDTCPATSAPISLTNLQVSVGGVNQLQSTLNYNYENFIEQINLAEALTSSDMGISCGLFSQSYWEMFRHYYVNIERSALTDKKMARNINISFQINSLVPTDLLTFIVYSDEFVIDIESGLITK